MQKLSGPTGLFFTNWDPKETLEWFESFQKPTFARAGNVASKTIVLPAGASWISSRADGPSPLLSRRPADPMSLDPLSGPVVMYEDPTSPFPHSMDPQLRKLGLHTSLVKGVPSLAVAHEVCKAGKVLSAEQAQLLKLVGVQMATFQVNLGGFYTEERGFEQGPFTADKPPAKALIQKPGEEPKKPKGVEEDDEAEMDDEEDSE